MEDAYAAGSNAVVNNYLKHEEQQAFAKALNACDSESRCVARVRAEFKKKSDENNAALAKAFAQCKATKNCEAYATLAGDGLPLLASKPSSFMIDLTDPKMRAAYKDDLKFIRETQNQMEASNQAVYNYLSQCGLDDELVQLYTGANSTTSPGVPDVEGGSYEYVSAISEQNKNDYLDLGLATALMLSPVDELTVGAYVAVKVGGVLVRASVKLVDGVKKLVTADGKVLDSSFMGSNSSFTASGATIHYGKNSIAVGDDAATINNFNRATDTGKGHNVIVHGDEYDDAGGIFWVNGLTTNASQIADAVRSNPNYILGTRICLGSCWSGSNGSAQDFANAIHAPVFAPTVPVAFSVKTNSWVMKNKEELPFNSPEPEWKMFYPK
jgi:hypothetical protein